MPKVSLHWILYGVLAAGGLYALHLWHDTQVRDAEAVATLKQALAQKTATDKAAQQQITQAQVTVQQVTKAAEHKLAVATTPSAQIALVNTQAGTTIKEVTPGPKTLSLPDEPVAQLDKVDLQKIAQLATSNVELTAQVGADKVIQTALQEQVTSRDKVISDQNVVITDLRGGSHWKRFLKAVKYTGIGIGIGAVAAEAYHLAK